VSSLPGSDAARLQDLIFLFSKEEKCVDLLTSQKSIGILVDIHMDLALLVVCWWYRIVFISNKSRPAGRSALHPLKIICGDVSIG
jgi:hypothetical protein